MDPSTLELSDDSRRAYDGSGARPVRTLVWRPDGSTSDTPHVLLSHGTGGAAKDLRWLAEPLAAAGFVVAAIDHHGNNHVDGYLPESFIWWWDRARDLSYVVDSLAPTGSVGAAGYSIGGYTVAALLGARLDPTMYAALVTERIPPPPTPEYPNLADDLRAKYTDVDLAAWIPASALSYADKRITAGFLLCPAMGPLVTDESLAAITVPTAIRWAGADTVTPPDANGMRYAAGIPGADGANVGPEVEHYSFVSERPGSDAARASVMADAVEFFERSLA